MPAFHCAAATCSQNRCENISLMLMIAQWARFYRNVFRDKLGFYVMYECIHQHSNPYPEIMPHIMT
jgi:hypothetical protein